MHKRKLIRETPALRLRILRLRRSIHHPSNSPKSKHVTLKYYLEILSSFIKEKSRMGNSDKAIVVVCIEFAFLILGTMGAGILVLFPFSFHVILQEVEDIEKRDYLREELGTLRMLGAAVIAIALLIWLIVVLTLCQGVRGISPTRLMLWMGINSIPTLACMGGVTTLLVLYPDSVAIHIPGVTFLLYKFWSLWVICSLRKDIRKAGPPNNFQALHHRQSRSFSAHNHPHCQS